jgi:outer membrane biosynthesis protein TonB
MNRLEKKCFFTATAAHALLFVILFIGPAFFVPSDKSDAFKQIIVYSAADISKELTQGGTPQDVQANPLPPPPAPTAEPKPPVETPKPPVIPALVKPEPKDLEPVKPAVKIKPADHGDESPPPPKKHTIKLNPDEMVSSKPTADKIKAQQKAADAARAQEAAEAKRRADQLKQFGNAISDLNNHLSKGTTVHFDPGTGGGGAATINYFDLIQSKLDNAWHPSSTLGDDTPTATISITISRDGTVSGHISRHSSNSSMDKSVQNVLDTVTSVEPFPSSFKEQQITASFTFDIKAKRQ